MPKPDTLEYVPPIALIGGISQQAPHTRFPHQVEDATNAVFSVADGASKRPGTWFVRDLTTLLPGDLYRTHPIDRDNAEQYVVVYGSHSGTMLVVVEEIGGLNLAGFVSVTAAAQTYLNLNSPDADDLRFVTIADYTLIANTTVPVGLISSDSYQVERAWRDYDVLISFTTADGYYFRTEQDTQAQPIGHWQYDVDGVTFAHINLDTVKDLWSNVSSTSYWRLPTGNPNGFKISFGRFGPFTITSGATWTSTSSSAGYITRTGAFADLAFRSGDHLFVGTDMTDTNAATYTLKKGWYRISAADDNTITIIIPSVGAGVTVPLSTEVYKDYSGSNVTEAYVGNEYEVIVDFTLEVINDLQDVALVYQRAIRAAGASEACVCAYWRGAYGALQITAPYRGSRASIYLPKPSANVLGGIAGAGDWTQSGYPFHVTAPASQVFNGSGSIDNSVDTLAPTQRWKRVPAPMQSEAVLDPDTMPVKMVRTLTSATKTIVGNTAANPTVVECTNHGLRNGQNTYWISSNSNLPITGTKVATVIDANHFSVPVNCTGGAGTSGSFRRGAVFDIDVVDWNPRTSGDKLTNPAPSIWQQSRTISDIGFLRDRLVLTGGESVVCSQQGDLFNFFNSNDTNVIDSDPIDLTVSSERVANIDFATHFKKGLTLFTLAGQQFDFSSDAELTAAKVSATPTTNYQTRRVRPRTINEELYFIGRDGCLTQLLEYRDDNVDVLAQRAADVTAHVPRLLPEDIRAMAVSTNAQQVIVLPESGDALYVYRSFWSGLQKQQSAWTRFDFDDSYVIYDLATLGDRLYMLTKTANLWFLERLPLSDLPDDCHYDDVSTSLFAIGFEGPYVVHLDRKFYKATGTWDGTKTSWDLGVQTPGSTVNRVVRLDTGQEYTLTGWSSTSVSLTGVNLAAVAVIIGCAYELSITLTRPFYLDSEGRPNPSLDCLIERVVVMHSRTGAYTVTGTSGEVNSSADPKTFTSPVTAGVYGISTGSFDAAIYGDASVLAVTIGNTTARPTIITGVQWVLDKAEGGR